MLHLVSLLNAFVFGCRALSPRRGTRSNKNERELYHKQRYWRSVDGRYHPTAYRPTSEILLSYA
eukprot:928525-Rhodomonas_salina.2